MTGTLFSLEVQPGLPPRLERLRELADDLYYSWDRHTRGLFHYLDAPLWHACRHNPKVFLRRIAQEKLERAVNDRTFLQEYNRTLANYDTYQQDIKFTARKYKLEIDTGHIAYFCAEFGLHESLPIYSGGLGILAGDYCKAASDMGLPFIAVGLLYRQGNLTQTIDDDGNQIVHYVPHALEDLPVKPALDPDGKEVIVTVDMPHARIHVKVWYAKAGHTDIFLMDTDIPENSDHDRRITFELYPSDRHNRIRQEIILGIGGVRALRQLGYSPVVWHINEGHPALLLLERWRGLIAGGMDFPAALQLAASNTVFTTHTPITAGHEVYEAEIIRTYLSGFIEQLGIDLQQFMTLGENKNTPGFNMTSFVVRSSRFHNGVSRIHRNIAAELEKDVWSDIPLDENPMSYVTNGIHVPTFLAREWLDLLEDPGCYNELLTPEYWQRIDSIPDPVFWSTHLSLKMDLLEQCCHLIKSRYSRTGGSRTQIDKLTRLLRGDDVMVIGFARRFATYKRANLLFEYPDRLQRILNNPERPVILLFAGKAHQNDIPGQNLIRQIHTFSLQPEFLGKIILLEGYDIALARQLVSGADVWLNTPEYPMEASGTSGMKAGINGVVNLSIMDGWWAEAYNGANGWQVTPHISEKDDHRRRQLEAQQMFDVLEHEIIPAYFAKTSGYSPRWVKIAKESMKTIIPQFNSMRMAMDYINNFYRPAITMHAKLDKDEGRNARLLAEWKKNIHARWHGVRIRRSDSIAASARYDETVTIQVGIHLNGLQADDIIVECLLGAAGDGQEFRSTICRRLHPVATGMDETSYEISFVPELSGLVGYKLRVYPYHSLLCHPFEMGFMKWL